MRAFRHFSSFISAGGLKQLRQPSIAVYIPLWECMSTCNSKSRCGQWVKLPLGGDVEYCGVDLASETGLLGV